jgi:hypothetical protein
MSKGSNTHGKIAARLSQAQALISEAMSLLGSDAPAPAAKPAKTVAQKATGAPDFTMPIRPFVKRHAADMNGARKFALLVAHLAQGDESKAVQLSDVESSWNKMTDKSLLGMKFNRLYSSEAKNNDWVHSPTKGIYHLRPAWKEIFE